VAQLVEAMRYKPEGRGFRFPISSLGFFIHWLNPSDRTMALDSAQPKNGYRTGVHGSQCTGL